VEGFPTVEGDVFATLPSPCHCECFKEAKSWSNDWFADLSLEASDLAATAPRSKNETATTKPTRRLKTHDNAAKVHSQTKRELAEPAP
jgi:hypothetical protein